MHTYTATPRPLRVGKLRVVRARYEHTKVTDADTAAVRGVTAKMASHEAHLLQGKVTGIFRVKTAKL